MFGTRSLIDSWQDRRIGREVAREREAVVEDGKRREETREPIIIQAPPPELPVPPKVEKRIERERQTPLFPEAVVGGLLPPLHLLEPAAGGYRTGQHRNPGIHLAPD